MDKSEQKKIGRLIKKELRRSDSSNTSKPTARSTLIKIISIVGGIMFLVSTLVYYKQFIGDNSSAVNSINTNASQYTKSQTDRNYKKDYSDFSGFKKMGDEALKQNKDLDAIQYYKQASSYYSKDVSTLTNLINLLVKNKLYEESLEYLEQLISVEPENISAYRVKGSSLYSLEKYDEAIKVYSKVVEMDPQNDNTYKLLGDITLKLNRYDEAIAYYKKALSIKEDVAVYQNLGFIDVKLGRLDKALNYYDKALQIDPENKDILKNKQEILKVQKY